MPITAASTIVGHVGFDEQRQLVAEIREVVGADPWIVPIAGRPPLHRIRPWSRCRVTTRWVYCARLTKAGEPVTDFVQVDPSTLPDGVETYATHSKAKAGRDENNAVHARRAVRLRAGG